jgi:hypothetical protein
LKKVRDHTDAISSTTGAITLTSGSQDITSGSGGSLTAATDIQLKIGTGDWALDGVTLDAKTGSVIFDSGDFSFSNNRDIFLTDS